MRVNESVKKWISMALCLCMLLQNCPVMAFAAATDNLCDHHTEHTAECGYREGSAGSACTHVHSEECYAILECLHTCGDECANGCTHECSVENGCIIMELDCHHTHGDCGFSQGTAEVPCGHTHNESCGYAQAVAGTPCANAGTDPECDHSGDCGFVAAVEGAACGHTACDDTCGYQKATEGTPCTHVCQVLVDSADSCYKLLCSHAEGGHDDACGYVEAVEAHECHYECAECAAVLTADETTEPSAEATTEPSTGATEPAPVCDCGTDDPAIHAVSCPVYVAPENPQCFCVEKCAEVNVWCDVCGFDYTACAGGWDEAADYASTPTYIASLGIAQDADKDDAINELSGHTVIDYDLNKGCGSSSDYIYMGYKTTTDPSEAITGIVFRVGENPPDHITYGGYTFYLVGGSNEDNTAVDNVVDLNEDAGSGSAYIYTYVTRSSGYGAPLTAMTVNEASSYSGWITATNTSGNVIDLNQDAGGAYIYLHYKQFSATVSSTYYYLTSSGSRTSSTQSATVKHHLETMANVPSYSTSVTYDGRTFTFKGWREDNTAGSATVTSPSATYITGNKTYRAVYAADVKLSYDANGGSGAPAAQKATQYINAGSSSVAKQSVSFTIPDSTYTHSTKCFMGWSADKTAATAAYQPGRNITISSNTTLYAVYADHSYTSGICTTCGEPRPDSVAVLSKNGRNVFAGTTLDTVIAQAENCTAADKAVVIILQDIDLGSRDCYIDSGVFAIDLNNFEIKSNGIYSTFRLYEAAVNVTVQDSGKTGKITGGIDMGDGSTLTVSGGTISDSYRGVYAQNGATVTISGGVISSDERGMEIDNSSKATVSGGTVSGKTGMLVRGEAVISGGTISGSNSAIYDVGGDESLTISGGTITGSNYDLYSSGGNRFRLTVGENGAGATFPGGITSSTYLYKALDEGMAYWAGDTMLSVGDVDKKITDKGDITIKAACTHESGTRQGYANRGNNHTYRWSCCKLEVTENHTFTDTKCVCGALNHTCQYTNGFCSEGCYEPAKLVEGYYQIKNGGNLFWFANYVNTVDRTANAKLTADIDLEDRPWTPIGSTGEDSNNFRGVFDGQNHTIRGLYVEGSRAGLGFFGEVRTGTVKNFTIYGEVNVIGSYDYVGGVIGSACGLNSNKPDHNGATIQNITSYVNLTAGAHGIGMVGGFIGYANHETVIENCSWYGTFDAGIYRVDSGAGGFIGRIYDTATVTIRNCGAYGTIKTAYQSGTFNNQATIYIGGFLSFSPSDAKTVLEDNLWAGRIIDNTNLTEANAHLSAYGTMNSDASITNCYALDSTPYVTTNNENKSGITTVTAERLKSGEVAYKLGAAWGQTIGTDPYPVLGGAKVYYGYDSCADDAEKVYTNDANASAEKPAHSYVNGFCTLCDAYEPAVLKSGVYEISNAGQLYWFAAQVNGGNNAINGKLIENITVNENVLNASGEPNSGDFRAWTPIGKSGNNYTGTFDGNGKTISGLYFNDSTTSYVGLFGIVLSSGTVQDVGVIDSYLHGNKNVGGVAGQNNGTVTDCYNTGAVSGSGQCVGGMVGYNNGTVTDCYNTGAVSGSGDYVGGMVGFNTGASGTVTDCYNTGAVSGSGQCVGGVVGDNAHGTVTDCYNTGAVRGDNYRVGGVVGYNSGGTVTNCYNTGDVNGGNWVGGVVGNNSDGNVTNCYNTGDVSGSSEVGGVGGRNYGSVTNCYYNSSVYSGNAIGTENGTVTNVEGKTTEAFASGEVAYLLQGEQTEHIWGQTIGEDDYPVLGGAKVYRNTCVDNIIYRNVDKNYTEHTNVDGFCAVCGAKLCDHSGNENRHTDCTKDLICSICGEVATPAAQSHTPEADDGDCTTAVMCENCEQIVVAAKTHNCGSDGKCTNDGCTFIQYALWVGGEQVTSENLTISGTTGTATYDPEKGTLTLNNYTYTGAGYTDEEECSSAIYYNGNGSTLNLVLVGESVVTHTGTTEVYSTSYGMRVTDFLEISGTGSLKVVGGEVTGAYTDSYGLCAGDDITIWEGSLTAIGGNATYNSYGVCAGEGVLVNGGTLTAIAGNAAEGRSYGVDAYGLNMGDGIGILTPVGGWYSDSDEGWGAVVDPSDEPAKEVKIGAGYTVTVNADANGTVSGAGFYAEGASVTLTVTPSENYKLESLTVDGEDVTASVQNGTYTFTMPAKAVAVTAAFAEVIPYDLWVGGQQFTSEKLTISGTTGTATYDPETNTLTLNGYTYEGVGYDYYGDVWAIGSRDERPLKLVLEGESAVTNTAVETTYCYGMYTVGDLEISGTGSLTATGGNADSRSCGVLTCGTLTVTGGSLTAIGGEANSSNGVYAITGIEVTGGSLTGNGGDVNNSYGVYTEGTLTVSGGSLTGNGGNANDYSYGVRAETGIEVTGGSLTGTGGSGTAQHISRGVHTYGTITVTGGSLTATGGEAQFYSYGVEAGDTVAVSETGKLTAAGGSANYSYGVYTSVDLEISGTGSLTATGGEAQSFSYGVKAGDTVAVSETGKLTAAGGSAKYSYGVNTSGDLEISGTGSLTATSGEAQYYSYGVEVSGALTMGDGIGILTPTGGSFDADKNTVIDTAGEPTKEVEIGAGYTVTVGEFSGGTVSGAGAYAEGASVTLTVTPDEGFELESLTVDGTDVTDSVQNGTYTFTMPAKAVTVSAAFAEVIPYDLWVGGQQFTSEKLTISGTTGTATYDPEKGTLTLNNYIYSGAGYKWDEATSLVDSFDYAGAIYYGGDRLKLVLEGENSVTHINEDHERSCGMFVKGGLEISGPGSLTVVADAANTSYGVYAETDITINSGTLTAISGTAVSSSGVFTKNLFMGNDIGILAPIGGRFSPNDCSIMKEYKAATSVKIGAGYTVSVVTQNGTISGGGRYDAGDTVTLTVSPKSNYILTSLMVNGVDVTASIENGTYSFQMPAKAVTVSATFVRSYDLWIGTEQITDNNLTVSSGEGTATYDPETNTLTLDNFTYSGGGYIDASNSSGAIYYGSHIPLNLVLVGENCITHTGEGDSDSCGLNVTNVIISGTGSLITTGDNYGVWADYISVISGSLTAISNATQGYSFGVHGKNVAVSGTGSLTAISNATSDGIAVYAFNGLTIGDGIGILAPVGGSISNHSVVDALGNIATNVRIGEGYTVSVNAAANGTVSGAGFYAAGDTVTLTVTPNEGYLFESLTVDGEDVTAFVQNGTYTFSMPAKTVAVIATFCNDISYSGWTELEDGWYYYDPVTYQPVTGIARVPYPTATIDGNTYAPDQESIDYAASKGETFIDQDTGLFIFGEDGKFQSSENGMGTYLDATRYAVNGHLPWHPGMVKSGNDYYYFIGDVAKGGNILATGDIYISRDNSGFGAVNGGVYTFGADGKLCQYEGITKMADGTLRYYEKARLMLGNGLTKVGEKLIYVRSNGALAVNQNYWVPANNMGIQEGTYAFDAEGFLVIPEADPVKNGIYWENGGWFCYENGSKAYNKGLISVVDLVWYSEGGTETTYSGVIYVRSNGQLATGKYWITNVANYNGTESFVSGSPYEFNAYGIAATVKNGIVAENGSLYYYQNNKLAYNAGVIQIDGCYYYVRSNAEVVNNRSYWITNVGDSGVIAKLYTFDENGVFQPEFKKDALDGIHNGYYYKNGSIAYGAGLIRITEDTGTYYIYVRSNGQLATGKYWPTNTNGYDVSGQLDFSTDGKCYI